MGDAGLIDNTSKSAPLAALDLDRRISLIEQRLFWNCRLIGCACGWGPEWVRVDCGSVLCPACALDLMGQKR